ncbi:MAG: hypothetical protein M3177_03465 [Pseudomonadota bacterium]|nr:hypothetical protein [Pseudomonadota bacterium]
MRTVSKFATAIAATIAAASVPASAQTQNGLVNVNVGDVVLRDILSGNEIRLLERANVLNNIQVQVPVNLAAAVCPNVAVLGNATQRATSCDATTGNQRLAQAIRRQYRQALRAQ